MTRKHFQKIAAIVSTIEDERVRKATALSFARWCMDENRNFRMDLFLKACEPSGGE